MRKIIYNGIEMYRYYSPYFPAAYIRTDEDRFYTYNPYRKVFIVGGRGWYMMNGKKYEGPEIYEEVARVGGLPIRKVVFVDTVLDSVNIYVNDRFFIRMIDGSLVMHEDGKDIEDKKEVVKRVLQWR